MEIDLKSLGITPQKIEDGVICEIADRLLSTKMFSEWRDEESADTEPSDFRNKLQAEIKKRIDAGISEIAEKHILPNATTYLENLVLQETTKWGEKKGEKVTFIQYMVQSAESYLQETVDSSGKTKAESDSYGWRGSHSRITALIHHHLHLNIRTAMDTALQNLNKTIAGGLEETVKIQIREVADKFKLIQGKQ